MASNEPIVELLARVTALEMVVTKLFVSSCIKDGVGPQEVLAEAERLKAKTEGVPSGQASAHLSASIDRLFNSLASALRESR